MRLKKIEFAKAPGYVEVTLVMDFGEFKEMFKLELEYIKKTIEGRD